MTIEEKTLEQIWMQKRNGEDCEIEYDVLEFLESTVEENTKLKTEIEQWQSTNLKLACELTKVECENYQLKAELERCKINKKCSNCKYFILEQGEYPCNCCEDECNWKKAIR